MSHLPENVIYDQSMTHCPECYDEGAIVKLENGVCEYHGRLFRIEKHERGSRSRIGKTPTKARIRPPAGDPQ